MSWPQMSEADGAAGAIGFFGKLPAIGDFVHRRLPDEFLASWDHWLQRVVVGTRANLGEAWLEHYLVAPFWRFALVPGVIGSGGWLGVVMPSVDRVGRYFPFTLALPVPGNVNFLETFLGAHAWFEALEDMGAQALHPQMDLAEWDGRLAAMPMPPLVLAGMEEDATVPLAIGRAGPVALALPGEDMASCWRLVSAVAAYRRPFSIFSGIAREQEGRVALATEGLPGEPLCYALLDGKWAEYGWDARVASPVAPAPVQQDMTLPVAAVVGLPGGEAAGVGDTASGAGQDAAVAADAELDADANRDGEGGWQGGADDTLPLHSGRDKPNDQVGR